MTTRALSRSTAGGTPHRQVAEIQRRRLLGGAVGALDELGFEQATVARITSRAGVSRRTFYEMFANREQCIAAALEDVAEQLQRELRASGLQRLAWRERMRQGLWAILCFLEREPALARLVVVHTLRSGGQVFETRERLRARLIAAIDDGRREGSRGADRSELTAEGVLGAVLTILHTRLVRSDAQQREHDLTGLLGELLAIVLLPYEAAAVVRREQARPLPPRTESAQPARRLLPNVHDPLRGLPMRVTYRTTKVLEGIGGKSGSSNREIAEYAGIADQGQVSKLLGRLERLGLVENHSGGHGKGEANAWALTPIGVEVTRSINASLDGVVGGHREVA
jgi:AcrR family transcriptional regulator